MIEEYRVFNWVRIWSEPLQIMVWEWDPWREITVHFVAMEEPLREAEKGFPQISTSE